MCLLCTNRRHFSKLSSDVRQKTSFFLVSLRGIAQEGFFNEMKLPSPLASKGPKDEKSWPRSTTSVSTPQPPPRVESVLECFEQWFLNRESVGPKGGPRADAEKPRFRMQIHLQKKF